MRALVHFREQGPGAAVVTQGGVGAARLFGVPFLAAGGYFLYELATGAVRGELTIAGWVLLTLFTAVFVVPGWILCFGRKRTRLDASRREATEEFDYLVFARRTTTRVPADAHVMLRYEEGASRTAKGPITDTGITMYDIHVYLVGEREKLVLLALFPGGQRSEAMAFARKASGFFGIDVQDRLVEHGEITSGGVVVERLGPDEAD
jgi:hypothetical protein